jgi:hypothetical protein
MVDLDEDAGLRTDLSALGPDGLRSLRRVLEAPQDQQDEVLRRLMTANARDMGQLIAMGATDTVVRLRLLRAIRDLGA